MKSILKKLTCFVAALMAVCGSAFSLTANTASAEESLNGRYYDKPVGSTRAAGDVETINFASIDNIYIETPNRVPLYDSDTLENACGPIGGGIVVGYYDKYFQNLIPNYTNYYPATGKYRPGDSTYVPAMIQELYTLMQTNVVAPGVSESECLDGLEAYVEGKGYSLSYTAVKPYNGTFSHTAYQNAINNGQPVILFCDTVQLVQVSEYSTYNRFVVEQESQDHIIVGFGYQIYRYYDVNGNNFRTDTYLAVATGWNPNDIGFVKINDDSWLDSGFAVDIY